MRTIVKVVTVDVFEGEDWLIAIDGNWMWQNMVVRVTHMLEDFEGLVDGWCVMSITDYK